MHAWMWAEMYPDLMDGVVPLSCQPVEISGRNWLGRRAAAEAANPSRSRGVTRRLLEGIGHLPMWEAVSETAGAVAAWAHATRGP